MIENKPKSCEECLCYRVNCEGQNERSKILNDCTEWNKPRSLKGLVAQAKTFDEWTEDYILAIRTAPLEQKNLASKKEGRKKFVPVAGLQQALSSLFEKCAYIDSDGKPAFVCTRCGHYHGFKKGCSWEEDRKKEVLGK